ncbi:hypothetical protein [Polynucleobacter necessarius]|nr:hypothetical protein [Polynucleobacter necessarius]
MSKRTNLYAMYGQTIVSTGNAYAGAATSVSVNAAISNYAVGVRHTF